MHAADCAIELEKRLRWRAHPEDWCRERVKIEPSWKVMAAKALGITVEEVERQYPRIQDKLIEVLHSVRDNVKTHVRSGHQVGKTLIASACALWWLDCYRPSRVLTTSATWTDVEMKLWGSIRDLYYKGGNWLGKEMGRTQIKLDNRWYAIGLSPERVEPFQGHNDRYVLVIFDEASSLDQKFSDAADAEATRLLEVGNPLIARGPYYQHSRSSEYNHIHISCLDHPNIVLNREIIPGGPRAEWVKSRIERWGEHHPLFLSRVAGEFPEESSDTWFPLSSIQASFELYKMVMLLSRMPGAWHQLGLDVARAGGDWTIGYDRDSVQRDENVIQRCKLLINLEKTDHHKTKLLVSSLNEADKYDTVNVDAGGEGSGLADELPPMGIPATRVLFGANPVDRDHYDCRAEMYHTLSKLMKAGTIAVEPDPSGELEEELSVIGGMATLKEKNVNGKPQATFWLPPKDAIKAILGRSPDKADGLALSVYTAPGTNTDPSDLGIS
jgi:hypothetical protein